MMRDILRRIFKMGLTLIDGGGQTTEQDPWDQANLELVPEPAVIPPGMRLVRTGDSWVVKSISGLSVTEDYSAVTAVSRAWAAYASLVTDFDHEIRLPAGVAVTLDDDGSWYVEFIGYGNTAASPDFEAKNQAMAYVQQLLVDVESEDDCRQSEENGTIELPQGFRVCTMEEIDYPHYGLRVAGYTFSSVTLVVDTDDGEDAFAIDELQRRANAIFNAALHDDVRIVRTSYGPYAVEYGADDDAECLHCDFSSHNEALRAVQSIKRTLGRQA